MLPSAMDVRRMAQTGRKGKAHGEDGIPAEVWHAIGQVITPCLQPLIWKIVLRFQEPVWWKGGAIVALLKSGATEVCENYRGVSIGELCRRRSGWPLRGSQWCFVLVAVYCAFLMHV